MKNLSVPISIVIAGLIIAGAIVYTQGLRSVELSKEKGTAQVVSPFTITGKDHMRGNPEAPVTIVEFSDFQCPFCQKFHPTVQQVLAEYPGQVRWVYKHFPLDQIHLQARPAAEASECVWEQKGN
ncbi:MAG: thioredoxin domain-containing protein, partial [Parcubacteria group bacterium]|nr:thioredoxin domain-containing protein [Parcubacteria group bacterium]